MPSVSSNRNLMTTCLLTNISFSCNQKTTVKNFLLEKQPEFCFLAKCNCEISILSCFHLLIPEFHKMQKWIFNNHRLSLKLTQPVWTFRIHWERKELTFKKNNEVRVFKFSVFGLYVPLSLWSYLCGSSTIQDAGGRKLKLHFLRCPSAPFPFSFPICILDLCTKKCFSSSKILICLMNK